MDINWGPAGPILLAALSAVGAVYALIIASKKLSDLGYGNAHSTIESALKDLAEIWEEKYSLEKQAHLETQRKLEYSQLVADDLRRQLDQKRGFTATGEGS